MVWVYVRILFSTYPAIMTVEAQNIDECSRQVDQHPSRDDTFQYSWCNNTYRLKVISMINAILKSDDENTYSDDGYSSADENDSTSIKDESVDKT